MPVAPIPPSVPSVTLAPSAAGGPAAGGGQGFASLFGQALGSLGALQNQADAAAQQLGSGQSSDVASAVIAAEKANLGLDLAVQVRDKAISAYQAIMQLQL